MNYKQEYKEGDVLRLIRVRFPGQPRPNSFLTGNLSVEYGQKVVALSDRGMTIGYVNSFPYEVTYSKKMSDPCHITRLATDEDIIKYKQAYQGQREAQNTFIRMASEHRLEMNLKDVEFTSYGEKIIFYYTAPTRVDFRELLKSLKNNLRMQIVLRQIPECMGDLGEVGPCGPELCLFINSLMEGDCSNNKNCNEFKCRLDYKDPFYEDKRSRLPKVGDFICTHSGEIGRVERLDLWNEEFDMLTDKGVLKRYVSEQWKETLKRKDVRFLKT